MISRIVNGVALAVDVLPGVFLIAAGLASATVGVLWL